MPYPSSSHDTSDSRHDFPRCHHIIGPAHVNPPCSSFPKNPSPHGNPTAMISRPQGTLGEGRLWGTFDLRHAHTLREEDVAMSFLYVLISGVLKWGLPKKIDGFEWKIMENPFINGWFGGIPISINLLRWLWVNTLVPKRYPKIAASWMDIPPHGYKTRRFDPSPYVFDTMCSWISDFSRDLLSGDSFGMFSWYLVYLLQVSKWVSDWRCRVPGSDRICGVVNFYRAHVFNAISVQRGPKDS